MEVLLALLSPQLTYLLFTRRRRLKPIVVGLDFQKVDLFSFPGYLSANWEVDSLETQEPFVLSMGSANRDYDCLFRAVGELGYRTIVVAGEHSTEGLDIPKNVDLRSGLSLNQCHALSRAARVNVVPIKDEDSPSGQVTFWKL